MRSLFKVKTDLRRGEAGMTMVEVIIAAMVLALGAAAVFGTLSSATKNAQRAKASQVALNRAQQELEAMRSLENDQLALTEAPPPATTPLNPNYRVNSSNSTFALIREPPSSYASLVVNDRELYGGGVVEGGIVQPGPTSFSSGDVTGKIYRYVVWRDDASCPAATCPGGQDYKEIVVAVKLDTPGNQSGERGYVEVASDFVDPTDSALNDPVPGASGVVTAQQLYLSDTPCASTGTTARQEIAGDHPLHNTLGTCANGLQTESTTPGAPDALLLGVPPDPDSASDSIPALYDYADNFYLEPTPDTDKGVQILRDDTSGCNYTPTGTTHPEAQVHRWVSDPMASTFTMVDKATLEFYTRTLNDEPYNGQLCVFLFKRHEVGAPPVATDTFLTNKSTGADHWIYNPGGTGWWKGAWEKVRLTMAFNGSPYTIPAGDRLGVALSVERSETTGDALGFMYDHPKFPSRIEIDTNTPIEGG
jgi:type II secretory pathway pseudopilin PulG